MSEYLHALCAGMVFVALVASLLSLGWEIGTLAYDGLRWRNTLLALASVAVCVASMAWLVTFA